uniref:GPI inositol-deacylase n=1 Tax=Trypanosoma congolense (strain IL3000) TaxID=1068625 RepID=G0UK25_TRYCI|nr:conserved hypothetical protein [Trypanosoma congolense IL3000]
MYPNMGKKGNSSNASRADGGGRERAVRVAMDVHEEEEVELISVGSPSVKVGTCQAPARETAAASRARFPVTFSTIITLALTLLYALSVLRLELLIKDFSMSNPFDRFPSGAVWYRMGYQKWEPRIPYVNDGETRQPFKLYRVVCIDCPNAYRLQTSSNPDVIIFFIHGNAGSYAQVHRLGILFLQRTDITGEVFSFDFSEQISIHRGELIKQQAAFVSDTIKAADTLIKQQHDQSQSGSQRSAPLIWLVGHSMGGVVARMVAGELAGTDTFTRLAGIITLNTPHRQMPIFLDLPLQQLYKDFWLSSALHRPVQENGSCNYPRILSITSGSLDMQVQQNLTHLGGSGCQPRLRVGVNTENQRVCNKTSSHDDILRDYCTIVFVVSALVNNSVAMKGDTSELPHQREWLLPDGVKSPAPPKLTFADFLSTWAELSMNNISFATGVVFFYTALILSAVYPFLGGLLKWIMAFRHSESSCSDCHCSMWHGNDLCSCSRRPWLLLILLSPHMGVVLLALAIGAVGRLLLVQMTCCVVPGLERCKLPWIADSLVCRPVFQPSLLLWHALGAVGPTLEGLWAGILGHRLLSVLLRLSLMVRVKCEPALSGLYITFKMLFLPRSSLGRNCDPEQWFQTFTVVSFSVAVVLIWYFLPLQISGRALAWFCLVHILLPLSASCPSSASGRRTFRLDAEISQAMVSVYALLHLLSLQPLFVWKNLQRAGVIDDARQVDGTCYVVEILLLILLFVHLVWSLYRPTGCSNQLQAGTLVTWRWSFARGGSTQLIAACACVLIFVVAPLTWLLSVPVESFRIVSVLVWVFPFFLLGPMFVPSVASSYIVADD